MVSAEVQRTLVKSPPELWSELSDPASLARHLGELGEIRITRVDPEKALEWEADQASGTVAIKPSGWGTRVTLTLHRLDGHEAAQAEAEPGEAQADSGLEHGVADVELDQPPAGSSAQAEPLEPLREVLEEAAAEAHVHLPAEPAEAAEPTGTESSAADSPLADTTPRRLSWWQRLFRRRRETDNEPAAAAEHEQGSSVERAPGPEAIQLPEPATAAAQAARGERSRQEPESGAREAGPGSSAALLSPAASEACVVPASAGAPETSVGDGLDAPPAREEGDHHEAEQAAVEQATALLSSVLDRLGAAHHRPFSRP